MNKKIKEQPITKIEYKIPMNLKVVPLNKVFPHEQIDPQRVERLIQRLKVSDVFTNPPIVVQSDDHYIVLDGATRVSSFKKLGYPHIVVQILSEQDNYTLKTWFHAIRGIDTDELLGYLTDLPEIAIHKIDPAYVQTEMFEKNCICDMQTRDKTKYCIEHKYGVNYIEALNTLTKLYINISHVSRTLINNVDILINEFSDLTAIVVFPILSMGQVRQAADNSNVVPAGITRFIIPGRVMHLNADFDYLRSDQSIEEKNKWLQNLVIERHANDQVRYYAEPMYLFDE